MCVCVCVCMCVFECNTQTVRTICFRISYLLLSLRCMRHQQPCPQAGRGLPDDGEEEYGQHRHRSQIDQAYIPTLTFGKFLNIIDL